MQEKKLVELWQLIDQVTHLKAWLKSPYGFPYMDDADAAVWNLTSAEDFLRYAIDCISNGKESDIKKWDDDYEDGLTFEKELQATRDIFANYSKWELTEETYLDRLESDQDDADRLSGEFETIAKGIQAIREAI